MSTGKRLFLARLFAGRLFAGALWAGVNSSVESAAAIDRETKWTAIKRPSVAHARERTSFAKAIDRGNTQ